MYILGYFMTLKSFPAGVHGSLGKCRWPRRVSSLGSSSLQSPEIQSFIGHSELEVPTVRITAKFNANID